MKILFFGDIVGKTGRKAVAKILPELKRQYQPDMVMANAENLAHGKGVTLATFEETQEAGVDFFTLGNHGFSKPEVKAVFERWPKKLIRPANVPDTLPGTGYQVLTVKGQEVLVINLLGQVFMEKQFDYGEIGNPFLALNQILAGEAGKVKVKILDFHAEATSEKRGMGFWADGRVSAVLGTHTHIPTADAQILPQGTGYLTDLGMVGARDSIIGVTTDSALKRFLGGEDSPDRAPLEVAESNQAEVSFGFLEIDEASGNCQNINIYRRAVEVI